MDQNFAFGIALTITTIFSFSFGSLIGHGMGVRETEKRWRESSAKSEAAHRRLEIGQSDLHYKALNKIAMQLNDIKKADRLYDLHDSMKKGKVYV